VSGIQAGQTFGVCDDAVDDQEGVGKEETDEKSAATF
jgi:hypothetical protein